MAAIIKILGMVILLGLIAQGKASECSLSDISVTQTGTGSILGFSPEWGVSITNQCICTQLNVKLNCKGFRTVERVDPSIFNVSSDGVCLVNNGLPINTDPITFRYAWKQSFDLTPNSSEIACSR